MLTKQGQLDRGALGRPNQLHMKPLFPSLPRPPKSPNRASNPSPSPYPPPYCSTYPLPLPFPLAPGPWPLTLDPHPP